MDIFISCVSSEFASVRERVRSGLATPAVHVHVQADFYQGGGTTLAKLDDYLRRCGWIIHLIGDGAGTRAEAAHVRWALATYPDLPARLPPLAPLLADPDTCPLTYTQWEYYLARYHGRNVLVFRAGSASERDPDWTPAATDPSQVTHLDCIRRLGEDRHPQPFTTAVEIIAEAQRSIYASAAPPPADPPPADPPPLPPDHCWQWPALADLPPGDLADRHAELALFRALLSDAAPAPVLLIEGPSKHGKTRLLAQFRAFAEGLAGLHLGWGDCKAGIALVDLLGFVRATGLAALKLPGFDREWRGARRDGALGSALLDDLQACPTPVLLLLDTWQDANAEVARWVETVLLPRCCRHRGLRLVIAGQRVPAADGLTAPPVSHHRLALIADAEAWHDYYHRRLAPGQPPLPREHFDTLMAALEAHSPEAQTPEVVVAMLTRVRDRRRAA